MADTGKQCVKFLMFGFNFIFFIGGCGLLGVGIWLKLEKGDYVELSTINFVSASNVAIVVGGIIVLVAFLGCCGAINEVPALLLTFFFLMFFIFILEVAAGSLAYSKRSDINKKLWGEFKNAIEVVYDGDHDGQNGGLVLAIDKFQYHFQCCGYESYMDWQNSTYVRTHGVIPTSCCIEPHTEQCGLKEPKALESYYKKGCFQEVVVFLKDHLLYLGILGVGLALFQILGLIFSMTLFCSIRNQYKGTYA